MKKLFFGAMLMLAMQVGNTVLAQDSTLAKKGKHGHFPKKGNMMEHANKMLKERLSLTDEQAKQVEEINKSFKPKLDEAKKQDEARRETMKKLHDEHDAAIKKILTPAQQTEFEKLKAERREKGKRFMDDRKKPFEPKEE